MNQNKNILKWLMRSPISAMLILFMIMSFFIGDSRTEFMQGKNRCYSCASENMKENFLTRSRGPQGRLRDPKIYDSMCDLDSWLIREKSAVECQGACFKWQQVLNNSGVLSYATIRDCYERMFDSTAGLAGPTPAQGSAYTTDCKHLESPLTCLDQSSIEEHTCFCIGDFCNFALRPLENSISFLICFMLIIIFSYQF